MDSTDTSHKSLLNGIKWTTASNVIGQVLTASITFVLAALLTPSQFGTVALAYIFITFMDMLVGFGFNMALIQRRELKEIHLDSVFWLNLGVGTAFTVAAILCSGWWARVNQLPTLQIIIIVLSAYIPLHGLSLVQIAILQKKMDFKSLAIRANAAAALGGAAGITVAVMGFGVWALVWQHLAQELVSVVLLWGLSDWRPRVKFSWKAVTELWNYAWKAFSGQIGVFAQNQTDGLLVGLLLGPIALGLYRLAGRLVEMILSFLARSLQLVSVPHFSRLQQNLPELNRSFIFGTHITSIFTLPAMAFLAGASPLLLNAIGHQWQGATMVLRILALLGVSKAMILLGGPLLLALSKPGINSINAWSLTVANALAVCFAAWIFGELAPDKQISLVAALRTTVLLFLFTPLILWQVRCASGVSMMTLLKTIWPSIVISLFIGCSQALVIQSGLWSLIPNPYITLFMSAALAGLTWLIGFRIMDPLAWQYFRKMAQIGGGWLRSAHSK